MKYFIVVYLVMCTGFTLEYDYFQAKSSTHPHSRIKEHILIDYDPTIRPVVNHQHATNVNIRLYLKSIDYDTFTNTFEVHSWIPLHWTDEHLKWEKKDFDNVDTILMHTYEIWTPDLSIANGRDQSSELSILSDMTCIVSYKGRVTCVPHVKSSAYCRAKLLRYPYDKLNCSIAFGSWVHMGEELNLTFYSDALMVNDYVPNAEWELVNISGTKIIYRTCCPNETNPSLKYIFLLKRYPGFHAATVVVPALVIMITTLLTFCLNPAEMERFCLACLNVIIHFLHLQFTSWFLPNFGEEVPLIIVYGRNSLVVSILALVTTTIFKRLLNKPEQSPIWISNVITSQVGNRVGQIFLFNYGLKVTAKNAEDGTNIIENREYNKQQDCFVFVKILDRICFLVLFIMYFCMFISYIPNE